MNIHVPVTIPASCHPKVRLFAHVINIDTQEVGLELRFRRIDALDGTGRLRVPRSARPEDIVSQMRDLGAILPSGKAAAQLVEAALSRPPGREIRTTLRAGWHGSQFVMAAKTLGGKKGKKLRFEGPNIDPSLGKEAGSLEAWVAGLEAPCKASSYLVFAIGVGFAAPLLDVLGESEGALFHFCSDSSGGKTLSVRSARSVIGRAEENDLATFGTTDRAMEDLCWANNGLVLAIDEMGRLKGGREAQREVLRQRAFMITSGKGDVRSQKATQDPTLANRTWRLLALSTGEKPLEDRFHHNRADGERVRHIDIHLPSRASGGVFDRAKKTQPAELAREVGQAVSANFGVALPAYLVRLMRDREKGKTVQELCLMVDDFVSDVKAVDAFDRRLARKFGIVNAAAVLAARYDVAPWTEAHARRCVRRVYRTACRSLFTTDELARDILGKVRSQIYTSFPELKPGKKLTREQRNNALGFRRSLPQHGAIVAIRPDVFVQLAGGEQKARAALEHLISLKQAVVGSGGKRHIQIQADGFGRRKRPRWVCLQASAVGC